MSGCLHFRLNQHHRNHHHRELALSRRNVTHQFLLTDEIYYRRRFNCVIKNLTHINNLLSTYHDFENLWKGDLVAVILILYSLRSVDGSGLL